MLSYLIGNNRIKDVLTKSAAGDRLPHSLLFVGDDGIGKKLFAIETARTMVCRSPKDEGACGKCASCKRADKFVYPKPEDKDEYKKVIFSEHPDIGMVLPSGRNIVVDAVRDLEREANFRPYEAEARIFIVDEADKMNDAASNALLKTLEEPATTTYIFLITSRPDSLLSTIRSRCQVLRFAPVETSEIESHLISKGTFETADADLAARLSNGSVGRALSLNLVKFRGQREVMLGVVRSVLLDDDRTAMLRISERMNDAANKDSYEETLDILQTVIRDVWLVRIGDEAKVVNADILAELQEGAKYAVPDRLAEWERQIETMREGLEVNINRKIATDALFMEMASG
ncbi:MAG: DNA polymerase III subunit delta' [Acidobacteriota bacterium]